MLITYLENRTGEDITFRRYVLGGWQGTQTDQTHTLTLVPGYNALPEDAQEVPTYYGLDRPVGVASEYRVSTDQYFRMSRIGLEAGSELLWSYSNYVSAYPHEAIVYVTGQNLFKDDEKMRRNGIEIAGGHGTAIAVNKITFDRDSITQALVTKEELGRITTELAARM